MISILYKILIELFRRSRHKNYFAKDGILAKEIKGFEYRKEQEEMAHYIQDAINEDRKIIIEAGTGTGKTLAYLIPAIKWAVANKKK